VTRTREAITKIFGIFEQNIQTRQGTAIVTRYHGASFSIGKCDKVVSL